MAGQQELPSPPDDLNFVSPFVAQMSDVFSLDSEDPATKATRKMDWEQFVAGLNEKCRTVLQVLLEGGRMKEMAKLGLSHTAARTCKDQLAVQIREFFGDDILKQIASVPSWRNNLDAVRQMMACRDERRPA